MAKIVKIAAIAIAPSQFCPAPRIIGIGPIRKITPPDMFAKFRIDAAITRAIPTKITRKLSKKSL